MVVVHSLPDLPAAAVQPIQYDLCTAAVSNSLFCCATGISCVSLILFRLPTIAPALATVWLALCRKTKEKTTPFGVKLMKSQVSYRPAQGLAWYKYSVVTDRLGHDCR